MGRDSFEIYAFKDGNWSADSVHEKKNLAISLALTLLNKTDKTAVRVVKKTSGCTAPGFPDTSLSCGGSD